MSSSTALNRTGVVMMTNKSGGDLPFGTVVIFDNTNVNGFTTTTTAALSTRGIGVILDIAGIANNAIGRVATSGWVPQVNLSAAATIGQFLQTSTVAGEATPHSSPQQEGDFAAVLESGTSPAAVLFGHANGPTGSVSDGDKGDITVSGGGTVWGIDAAAVTFAKIQDASALSVLGRSANSTGVMAAIAAGSDHQVLRRSGTAIGFGAVDLSQAAAVTGVLPGVQGGGLVLLDEQVAAVSAELDFTGSISSLYDEYILEVIQLVPATDGTGIAIQVSTNGGASYDTGNNYSWGGFFVVNNANANQGAEATSSIVLGQSVSNTASEGGFNGYYRLFNPGSAAAFKHLTGQSSSISTANGDRRSVQWTSGTYNSTTAVNAFRVLAFTGNLTSGTVRLYGIAK